MRTVPSAAQTASSASATYARYHFQPRGHISIVRWPGDIGANANWSISYGPDAARWWLLARAAPAIQPASAAALRNTRRPRCRPTGDLRPHALRACSTGKAIEMCLNVVAGRRATG